MVTRYLKLFATTLVAILVLASCRNERTIDLYGEEGDPNALDVIFNVRDFEEVNLRSHLHPEDEHRIEEIVIWVFDQQGQIIGTPFISHDAIEDCGFEPIQALDNNQAGGAVGKGVPFGGTKKRGQVGGQMKLRLKNLSDRVTIVALANFTSKNFALEDGATNTKFTSDAQFKAVKEINDLRKLRLKLNQGGDATTSSERFESPLMFAVHPVKPEEVASGKVAIQLTPYIAKITANVKPGPGVEINSIRYHYENVPTRTDIINSLEKSQGSITELALLPTPTTNMLHNKDKSSFRAEGYLIPNYAKAKKLITANDVAEAQAKKKDDGTGYTAFDLRQKRVKEDAAGGYVENKEWMYAPDEVTTLVIDAELTLRDGDKEKIAILTYTVVLGDFSGVKDWSHPDEADLTKINNYSLESGTHYKYNITINGINNVIVEADSPDRLVEPNPSVEGTVIGNKPTFELDSHYEQRTFLLTSTDFDIFSDVNNMTLKPDAKLQFMVQSPFQPLKLIAYTAAQAKAARQSGVPQDKLVDNDWIRIYVHDPAKQPNGFFDNNNLPEIIYTKTKGDVDKGVPVADYWEKTLTVEQFFAWLLDNPKPLFDKKNAICITMFVDEYFYQWDPTKVKKENRTRANADTNLWKTFCNAPDRKFFLLTGDLHTSADQKSHYTEGTYLSVSQHSIKTIFTRTAEGLHIWGVESIDEYPNRRWMDSTPNAIAIWYNVYKSNGWPNTWNLLAGDISKPGQGATDGKDGGWVKGGTATIMKRRLNTGNGKQDEYWSYMTMGGANGVDMREASNRQAVYSPLTRNRDLNRDDKFQASEMKWYIPSQTEAYIISLSETLFPAYAKLDGNRTAVNAREYPNCRFALYTSTMYRNNAVGQNSHNPVLLVPELQSMMPLFDLLTNFYNVGVVKFNYALDRMYTATRLIRDLGVVEDEVTDQGTTYHMREEYRVNELNTFMKFKPKYPDPGSRPAGSKDRTSGEFIGGFFTPELTRTGFVDGELPTHTEKDSGMRIYKKGFKVAGSYVQVKEAASIVNRYGLTYDELKGLLLLDKSPCKKYYEEPDKSDLGKWRLPNIVELALMSSAMPRDYWYYSLEAENGTAKKVVWSATTPSFTMPNSRSTYSNFFLYLDQQFFITTTFEVKNFGGQAETWQGYMRCVRDIE